MNVRLAGPADARVIGQLLHDFNTEYEDATPGPQALAERLITLMATDSAVLLAYDAGLAVLRFRLSIWAPGQECYLAELYVRPERRGEGLGRALLEAAIVEARRRGADHMELGTSEDDVAARALYEEVGFRRTEGDGGPLMYVYEREL